MARARLEGRLALIATDKVALDPWLAWLSMSDAAQALHAEKAQIRHIQAAIRQVRERQGPAFVVAPTLLEPRALQLAPQHIPAHEQLDGRLAGSGTATTASPYLGQFRGQGDAA